MNLLILANAGIRNGNIWYPTILGVLTVTFVIIQIVPGGPVDQLVAEHRLTPSLILRSLAVGNAELIVHVIAFQCQLGPQYVRDRLVDGDTAAIEKLWHAAELPPDWLELART